MSGIYVVVVNYRTPDLAVECLGSLARCGAELLGGRVIVADNDSGDGSVECIRGAISSHGWAAWAEVLSLPRNGGFAYGNNAAIRRVREICPHFSFVVMLNPDAVVRPGSIACLAEFLDANPNVGIAGARIENGRGEPQVSAHAIPSPLREFQWGAQISLLHRLGGFDSNWRPRTESHACDWVSGACMAVRREVFDAVGPLDEGFFLYFEEVDFCIRARRSGWACWFVPDAHVVHQEGAATGIRVANRRRPSYWYASRRRFFVKCYGALGLVAADLLWAVGRVTLLIRRALRLGGQGGRYDEPKSFAFDLLVGDLRALMNGGLRDIHREASHQ